MVEKIRLYHGTLMDVARPVQQGEIDLFGVVDKEDPALSGNLTDSRRIAQNFAVFAPGFQEGRSTFAVMIFEIPSNLVINHGPIACFNEADSFSTTEIVPSEQVPGDYLRRLSETKPRAVDELRTAKLLCFRVRSEYLMSVEELGEEV